MEHENSHNLSSTGIFVEIAKSKLCGSKWLAQKSLDNFNEDI